MKTLPRLVVVLLGIAAVGLFGAALLSRPPVPTKATRPQSQAARVQLSGEQARVYLEQSGEGKSLAQALTAARFGLAWQESAPGDKKTGGGYLGMSHEQNLNVWFGQDGVTVRPTLSEERRDQGWTSALHLERWGYGKQLADVPPIISRKVKENRIEYGRASFNPKSEIRNPQLTEWYENRAEGIEQGFTLNERPTRSSVARP